MCGGSGRRWVGNRGDREEQAERRVGRGWAWVSEGFTRCVKDGLVCYRAGVGIRKVDDDSAEELDSYPPHPSQRRFRLFLFSLYRPLFPFTATVVSLTLDLYT